jgi:hypothetical protein
LFLSRRIQSLRAPLAFDPSRRASAPFDSAPDAFELRPTLRLVDRAPGVGGVEVSFVGRPNVSLQVAPCGIALGDVPGVHEFIRGKIADALKEKYVEPRRFYKDVERAFLESGRDAAIASAAGGGRRARRRRRLRARARGAGRRKRKRRGVFAVRGGDVRRRDAKDADAGQHDVARV